MNWFNNIPARDAVILVGLPAGLLIFALLFRLLQESNKKVARGGHAKSATSGR